MILVIIISACTPVIGWQLPSSCSSQDLRFFQWLGGGESWHCGFDTSVLVDCFQKLEVPFVAVRIIRTLLFGVYLLSKPMRELFWEPL